MHDLRLWRRLTAGANDDGLCDDLEELASQPLRRRMPWLVLAAALTEADAPAVRIAALHVLAGVRGVGGLRRIVTCLDDDDANVRLAAVEALRACARQAPARWAHAVFHPRPDVRAATLQGEPPAGAAHLAVFLRADPHNAAAARAWGWPATGGGRTLPLMFDMYARKLVSAAEVGERLTRASEQDMAALLEHEVGRDAATVDGFVDRAVGASTMPAVGGRDILDAWCEIVLEVGKCRPAAFRAIFGAAALAADRGTLARRIMVCLVRRRAPAADDGAGVLCARCEPRFLAFDFIAADVRRRAAAGLIEAHDQLDPLPDDVVDELLGIDIATDATGHPDLTTVGAIAGLRRSKKVSILVDRFGRDALIDAARRDKDGWASLCRLRMDNRRVTIGLLDHARTRDAEATLELEAIAVLVWATHQAWALNPLFVPVNRRLTVFRVMVRLVVAGTLNAGEKTLVQATRVLMAHCKPTDVGPWLATALGRAGQPASEAEVTVVRTLLRRIDPDDLAAIVGSLRSSDQQRFVELADTELALPHAHELAIARALRATSIPEVTQWAERLLQALRAPPPTRPRPSGVRALAPAERDAIATCPDHDLADTLAPALRAPSQGLTAPLGRRTNPQPHVAAATALLGCHDVQTEVAMLLDRFGSMDPSFVEALHHEAVTTWQNNPSLPPLGHACLHRWERHAFILLEWLDRPAGGLAASLSAALALPGRLATHLLWSAIASVVVLRRYRQPEAMEAMIDDALLDLLVEQLDTTVGPWAARILVAIHRCGVATEALARRRSVVLDRAPDLSADVRRELDRWIRIDGLPIVTTAHVRAPAAEATDDEIDGLRRCTDLDMLAEVCRRDARARCVQEAALRLVELGSSGQRRLTELFAAHPPPPLFRILAASIGLWDDAAALLRVRALCRDQTTAAAVRFACALGLVERGETDALEPAVAAVVEPSTDAWFRRADWDALMRRAPDPVDVAMHVAAAEHPHAHHGATKILLERPHDDARAARGLADFLEAGSMRPAHVRRAAARWLLRAKDGRGLPILLEAAADQDDTADPPWSRDEPATVERAIAHLVEGALIGGKDACSEACAMRWARSADVPTPVRAAAMHRVLEDGVDPNVRADLTARRSSASREAKLLGIAETFAWGVRRGRELTGRLLGVHMTSRRADLGYTPIESNRIYVSVLPLLTGDRHGRDVVEGLVLHEIGHQVHHRGAAAKAVWDEANRAGLFDLLNLVADEHLERNLRARDAAFGDRLKRLGAYAFLHSEREMSLDALLASLRADAFDALASTTLAVAYADDCVRVARGALLQRLERCGHPFARFVRALRMGLGNRHHDPLVERALGWFGKDFRHLDMEGLWTVTRALADLFGGARHLAQLFGGHESLPGDERETTVLGEGIDDDEVQREVERILDPRRGGRTDAHGRPDRLTINVSSNLSFERIHDIERIVADAGQHRALASEVRRHADRLRRYLSELGLALVPRRARLRGRAFDTTRVRAVVTRKDPRMLVARQSEIHSDLFIGVVIDCSSSMSIGASMDKARRFGVLIAEAVAPLAGVDARFFGFTDRTLYDAGDDRRCAVASLEPGGGNNDAAALLHVAKTAAASRRKAKLLVMISDGLPTECSVDALRSVVSQMTRRMHMCVAQVAVRPLEEVCFEHYVVLDTEDLTGASARFGDIVSGLARRALGR